MKDTVVGILGVVLVVGSMAGVLQAQDAGPGGEDSDLPDGPPPILGQATWTASDCTYALVGWQVPPDQVADHVGPWEPRARGGTTFFGLYAYECPQTTVSGLSQPGETRGGGAMVFVEPPGANLTANTSAGDAFAAVPEVLVGQPDGDLAQALAEHGFTITEADVSIAVTELAVLGRQATITWSTPGGTVEARGPFAGAGQEAERPLDLLATDPETFGLQTGPLSGTLVTSDTVTVTASGQTWVSELDLGSTPDEAALFLQAQWDLDVLSRSLSPMP